MMQQGIGGLPQQQAKKTAQLAPQLKMAMAMQSVANKKKQAQRQGQMQQPVPQGTIMQQLQSELQGLEQELGSQGAPSRPPSMRWNSKWLETIVTSCRKRSRRRETGSRGRYTRSTTPGRLASLRVNTGLIRRW